MSPVLDRILEVADQLTAILEAPRGLKHQRHQYHLQPAIREIKRIMAQYFERQKHAVLAAVKPHLQSHIEQFKEVMLSAGQPGSSVYRPRCGGTCGDAECEAAMAEWTLNEASTKGKSFAQSALPVSLHPLKFAATAVEQSEYADAITGAILGAAKVLTEEMEAGEVIAPNLAGSYLAENSLSKLTGDIDRTSVERLQDALATAWDKGGDYDSMVSAITNTFDDFSETRAAMIAQTEANDAYSYGRHETAAELEMTEKEWDPDGEACEEICQPNADAGWIPIDDDFPSGDDMPTAHPRCDCGCNYRKGEDDE